MDQNRDAATIEKLEAEIARLKGLLNELDPEWDERDERENEVVASLPSECRIPRELLDRLRVLK
jgi:hypothetical protein